MEAIYEAFPSGPGVTTPIERVVLVPGAGGVFDVKANGELLFSKHDAGRHPEPHEVLKAIRERL